MFQLIILLNILEKLIKKVIGKRLQTQSIISNFFILINCVMNLDPLSCMKIQLLY